ncbi:MAG: GTP-binding protein [Bacteroidales bacterium]|nr:GTP-binding protein [Bacteroidales bacterium]
MENISGKIPVTILTGFLGAGKTTLLNNIIKKYSNKRFAVIENEFGEIGIDGGLIVGNIENMYELSNGCICCNLSDGLQETLNNLLTSRYKFDNLLIETTGIADPAGVIDNFLAYEEFHNKFVIDSVICLADAMTYVESSNQQSEVHRQLAVADIIVLNKIEDVTPERGELVKKLIRSVNPTAKMYAVSHADISNCDIIETFAYTSQNIEKLVVDFKNATPLNFELSEMSDNNLMFATNPKNKHNNIFQHSIVSEGFTIYGNLDAQKFVNWLQAVLQYNSQSVYRVKGILSIADSNRRQILQSVRQFFIVEEGQEWKKDEQRFTKLVFIGKKLDREAIEKYLKSMLV